MLHGNKSALDTHPIEGSIKLKTLIKLKFVYMAYESLSGWFCVAYGMLL